MPADTDLVALTADVASAFVAHNSVAPDEVPALIASIHAALAGLGVAPAEPERQQTDRTPGAVNVRKSLANPANIVSMIDGKPYRTLTRHLTTNGHTPESYRQRYGLKPDYPMVAPSYSEERRAIALARGLGRKSKVEEPAPLVVAMAEPAPKRKPGRPPKLKPMSGADALASERAMRSKAVEG